MTLRYYHARLQNIYEQDFAGTTHSLPLGPGELKTDLRVFDPRNTGGTEAGKVDSLNAGVMITYRLGSHSFGLGYIAGGEPGVISDGAMSAAFANPKEHTTVVRYDYNFVAMGIPGLTGMIRYMRGSDIDLPQLGGANLKESSKDVEVAYVVQSGPAKNLAIRLRHAFYRNDLDSNATFRSDNETRINFDYTLKIWGPVLAR
ncbi:OprD family outer membrane porin [Pantoea sp. Ap-967]|uniref:OprD family outer membrane porin n=1 Tax=Pantoea sp. Ap-967 TaxID=2608362 RepID=UPI00196437FA|nr:OprD family outer membrane porin [Pantoea sp. Ap-967]